jgi:hypothetical protein
MESYQKGLVVYRSRPPGGLLAAWRTALEKGLGVRATINQATEIEYHED